MFTILHSFMRWHKVYFNGLYPAYFSTLCSLDSDQSISSNPKATINYFIFVLPQQLLTWTILSCVLPFSLVGFKQPRIIHLLSLATLNFGHEFPFPSCRSFINILICHPRRQLYQAIIITRNTLLGFRFREQFSLAPLIIPIWEQNQGPHTHYSDIYIISSY